MLRIGVQSRHGTTLRLTRRAMVDHRTIASQDCSTSRWEGTTTPQEPRRAQWHSLGSAHRSALARPARTLSAIPNLPPTVPGMGALGSLTNSPGGTGPRLGDTGQVQARRVFHRRDLCGGEKGGSGIGKTKRGKGTKLMAVADGAGLPVAVYATSASPHEITLVEATLAQCHTRTRPHRIIGDLAYDSDPLDRRLARRRIELIAPHKINRSKPATQDGRPLRRYRRRWKIERLFYLGFVHLGCILILLNNHF